jgi:hypothetical protein
VLTYSIIFLAGALSTLPLYYIVLKRMKKKHDKDMEVVESICFEELSELVNKMNHEGPIPNAASAMGLLNITLWAINNCIDTLNRLMQNKDWNTKEVTSNLSGIVMVELSLLYKKLNEFLESKRNILKDYHIPK